MKLTVVQQTPHPQETLRNISRLVDVQTLAARDDLSLL